MTLQRKGLIEVTLSTSVLATHPSLMMSNTFSPTVAVLASECGSPSSQLPHSPRSLLPRLAPPQSTLSSSSFWNDSEIIHVNNKTAPAELCAAAVTILLPALGVLDGGGDEDLVTILHTSHLCPKCGVSFLWVRPQSQYKAASHRPRLQLGLSILCARPGGADCGVASVL